MGELRQRAHGMAVEVASQWAHGGYADLQGKIEQAILRGMVEALEEAANFSPNGCDVSAADMPHTVWKKYSDGLRERVARMKGAKGAEG